MSVRVFKYKPIKDKAQTNRVMKHMLSVTWKKNSHTFAVLVMTEHLEFIYVCFYDARICTIKAETSWSPPAG